MKREAAHKRARDAFLQYAVSRHRRAAATPPDSQAIPGSDDTPEPIVRAYTSDFAGALGALHEALGVLLVVAYNVRLDIQDIEIVGEISQERLLKRSAKILSEAARASRLVRRAAKEL